MVRIDIDDEVYRTAKEKYKAIIADIEETHRHQQPVLVGTVSIEKSETLSALLKQRGIPHQVLNARYHEQEASIVAQAGVPGAVREPLSVVPALADLLDRTAPPTTSAPA